MSNVIDIRTKKSISSESDSSPKLRVDHTTGKITGSPHFRRPEADDFGDRMQRIRASLEKISALMNELKKDRRPSKDREDD